MNAALALQRALHAVITQDHTLVDAMGGAVRLYDHAPADVPFPYLTFGRTRLDDWSTDDADGAEHDVVLNVWSKARGRTETLMLMERLRGLLHDRPLTLDGYRLVNLRMREMETRYNDELSVYHGTLRLRAVTEAL